MEEVKDACQPALSSSGTTLAPANYLPYGTNANAPGTFAYTGQRIDPESGHYYYRARHYSPLLGRFLQPDPIRYRGGINLYAYVNNDPLNATDPDGHVADYIGGAASNFYNQTILQAGKDVGGLLSDPSQIPSSGLYRAAPTSDIFTQFDVRTSSLNGAGTGTAKIYGPNSIFGPRLGITEMPPATNIAIPQ